MNLILYAIPGFLLLLLVEILVDHRRGTGYYRLNDAIASLSTGLLSQTMGFATRFAGFLAYGALWAVLPHPELVMNPPLWIAAFVLYDFCYYWNHRFQHSVNFFWGIHAVHHQSEEYNLTTALRQPFNGFLLGSVFYLPLLFLGFPPVVVITVGSLNLIYQFWVHTRFIGTLGWMEKVFVTPMNHRVHHAINDPYIDRNFGGVFILWDRLVGTYQPELAEEPCAYGVRKPLQSWNPFLANFHVHWQLLRDCWHTRRWRDRLRLWFMPTGWRPPDVEHARPLPRCLPDTQRKYDRQPASRPLTRAVLAVHLVLMGWTIWFLLHGMRMDFLPALAYFLPLGGGLWVNSRILESRPHAVTTATLFWLACATLPTWIEPWRPNAAAFSAACLFIAALFAVMGHGRGSPARIHDGNTAA